MLISILSSTSRNIYFILQCRSFAGKIEIVCTAVGNPGFSSGGGAGAPTPKLGVLTYYYRPHRSCGQGNIFTPVCHSVHREGLPQCMLGYHPPGVGTPPQEQAPPRADTPRHTVNERPVRILLQCILILQYFCWKLHEDERIWTPP